MDSPKNTRPEGRPSSQEHSQGFSSGEWSHSEAEGRAGGRKVQQHAAPTSSAGFSGQNSAESSNESSASQSFQASPHRGLPERSVSLADDLFSSSRTPVLLNDPSCEIDPSVEENYVTVDDQRVKVREERDRLLAHRADLMDEQRTLLAKEYMKDQGVIFLKALDDPAFAKANNISVVLEINGRAVQLVPPLDGQEGISEADVEVYRSYVLSSTANALNSIPPLKTLQAEMKENGQIFKKTGKKLKKLGVTIDLKRQNKMLMEHTSVVVELSNNSGTICGVPSSEIYLPDEVLKRAPKATLTPDYLYVRTPDGVLNVEDDQFFGTNWFERGAERDEYMEDYDVSMLAEQERSNGSGVDPTFPPKSQSSGGGQEEN